MGKRTKRRQSAPLVKQTRFHAVPESDNDQHPVFLFDLIDRDGKFAFAYWEKDFPHKEVLEKLIHYSLMTWGQIRQQTHGWNNKSKHHHLSDAGRLSPEARHRLGKRHLDDKSDLLFSFAFDGMLRIIGIKDNEGPGFHVLWYDPNHEVYPVAG